METPRQFREWAGRPPYREMAVRCGHRAGVSTMDTAQRQDELPDRLWLLDAIVEGCGGSKNRIYKVFRKVGRSVRTVALLRYLADPQLRARIAGLASENESSLKLWTTHMGVPPLDSQAPL